MPIYFNLESHLWIGYLLFFNGLLLQAVFFNQLKNRQFLPENFETPIVVAFFISVGFNGLGVLVFAALDLRIALLLYLHIALSILLIFALVKANAAKFIRSKLSCSAFSILRLSLYAVVFLLLFSNGGLIEQTADSWWHMSFANKINLENTYFLEVQHLLGLRGAGRDYPPLWHGNLAVLSSVSSQPVAVFWNSFTAWGAVLKCMAFYIFVLSLTKNQWISFLSAFLFFLLPGMGVSYMRVSSWPSHSAYVAMFLAFALYFRYLDYFSKFLKHQGDISSSKYWSLPKYWLFFTQHWVMTAASLALLIEIYFLHRLELVWIVIGVGTYGLAVMLYRFFSTSAEPIETTLANGNYAENDNGNRLLHLTGFIFALMTTAASLHLLGAELLENSTHLDLLVAYLLPIFIFSGFLFLSIRAVFFKQGWASQSMTVYFALIFVLVIVSIDYKHLLSLFVPELAYPGRRWHQLALLADGIFGSKLEIPGWHLQLRQAYLYTGVIALPIIIYLMKTRPNRLTLFVGSNYIMVFVVCTSAYFYQWFSDLLRYDSAWRVATLMFHPIVIATSICWLIDDLRRAIRTRAH